MTLDTAGNSADLRASFIVGSHYAAGNAPATISNVHVINGTLHNTAANGASSIGGVVGRTQKNGDLEHGSISNCTNNGTVICAAQFAENIYVGAYNDYGAGEAKECFPGRLYDLNLGGVTFSPYRKNGVAGLLRIDNNIFLPSEGNADFLAGPLIVI